MSFEVQNALLALDGHTPDFFVIEALADANPKSKLAAAEALRSLARREATRKLLVMLRLY